MLGFVIQLKPDDIAVLLYAFHQLPDDPLRMVEIHRAGDVHILPGTVFSRSAFRYGDDFRVGCRQPGRHRVSGRTHNYGNPRFLRGLQRPAHMGEIEHPVFRFFRGPGGFRNTDDIDARLPHHLHILPQPFLRHVLVIVRYSIKQTIHCNHLPFSVSKRP